MTPRNNNKHVTSEDLERAGEEMVQDTIATLHGVLKEVCEAEFIEMSIAKELADVANQFDNGDDCFYKSMAAESVARQKNLLKYRLRTESILDRLHVFTKHAKPEHYLERLLD